jgi:hypothetical protein
MWFRTGSSGLFVNMAGPNDPSGYIEDNEFLGLLNVKILAVLIPRQCGCDRMTSVIRDHITFFTLEAILRETNLLIVQRRNHSKGNNRMLLLR